MIAVLQAVLVLVLNLIPAGGVVVRGWSPATALTLYWCENVVGAILIAVRIALHRRWTRKRGHYRLQINVEDRGKSPRQTYLAEFTALSLMFCLVHGVFLAALMVIVLKVRPERSQIVEGLAWMVTAQVGGFLLDLVQLRKWPFAALKRRAELLIGRIGLIHFSIMGGMLIAAFSSRPRAFFAAFGTLKTLADLGSLFPGRSEAPPEAPRWFLWITRRLGQDKHWKTRQDVATWWRETERAKRLRAEEDEQVIGPIRVDRPDRSR